MPAPISTPDGTPTPPPPVTQAPLVQARWATALKDTIYELRQQRGIAAPLTIMNLTWFAKLTITTIFLGRLGDLQLAGGALGLTFANVTGFSVLTGLCGAMEPICGQAHGAGNRELLRKTLLMAILLLLAVSLSISFLWLNIDTILLRFGQKKEIASLAKKYVVFLLPDLVVTSFLIPLKVYLSSQGITLPALFSSATALVLHLPLNVLLSKLKGLEGVAMAVWLTDLTIAIMLALYVFVTEVNRKSTDEVSVSWWKQSMAEWARILRLAVPCCLNTCMEWWCYEILVVLTGRLPDPKRMLSVITIVLNFDYLLYSAMLSLATSASVRVSNELGAGRGSEARTAAYVSMCMGALGGLISAVVTVGARGWWGMVFSRDMRIVMSVKSTMLIMAVVEVVNFPLAVSGGIVRGTARPLLGMYASVGGFYLVALPLAVLLGFKAAGLGLSGMLLGFLVGGATSGALLLVFVACIDWEKEAEKAQRLAAVSLNGGGEPNDFEGINFSRIHDSMRIND